MSADLGRIASVTCSDCDAVIPADLYAAAPVVAGVREVGCPECGADNRIDLAARARAVIAATQRDYDNVASAREATGMWWCR